MANPDLHYGKYRIRWTDEHGCRHQERYDNKRDAFFALQRHQVEVEEIKRGVKRSVISGKIFSDLCDYWIANRAITKRSGQHDVSIINCHLRPAFGSLNLRDLGVAQVDKYKAERIHLNQKTISNHLTLLKTMLGLAFDLKWITEVPRIKKPRTALFSTEFSHLRTDGEIKDFLLSAQREGEQVYIIYASAIYTGLRAGELATLRWDCVDLERRLITVQSSFNGPTKAGDVRYVPILDPLLPILREWKLKIGGQYVFTNERGGIYQPSARIFQEVLQRVLTKAGFQKRERNSKLRHYICFHDLRHTFASFWVRQGGDIFRLQKILGHKSITMTMRYAHLAPDAYSSDYGRLGKVAPGKGIASVTVITAQN